MDGGQIDVVEKALMAHIAPFWGTVELSAYLIGVILVCIGLYRTAHASQGVYAKSVGGGVAAGALPMIFGAALLVLPTILDLLTYSIFSEPAPTSALQYAPAGKSSSLETEVRFTVMVIHFVGLYAVIRGIIIWTHMHDSREDFWAGAVHFIGGALALRIDLVLHGLGIATGGVMSSTIAQLFPS